MVCLKPRDREKWAMFRRIITDSKGNRNPVPKFVLAISLGHRQTQLVKSLDYTEYMCTAALTTTSQVHTTQAIGPGLLI